MLERIDEYRVLNGKIGELLWGHISTYLFDFASIRQFVTKILIPYGSDEVFVSQLSTSADRCAVIDCLNEILRKRFQLCLSDFEAEILFDIMGRTLPVTMHLSSPQLIITNDASSDADLEEFFKGEFERY